MPVTSTQDAQTTSVAVEKQAETGAPLRLMTQFLRAVSENRMEDALALAQTALKYEPKNKLMLDYQETLAQYINNERELAAEGRGSDETSSSGSSRGSSTSTAEGSTASESDTSSGGQSRHDGPEDETKLSVHDSHEATGIESPLRDSAFDKQEEQRLGRILRDLRERRALHSMLALSTWDEDKFAASSREVETVLWNYSPAGAKQSNLKRAKVSTSPRDYK